MSTTKLPEAEARAWLLLVHTPGAGGESVRRLLAAFGSPQAVLAAPRSAWHEVAGAACAQALSAPNSDTLALVDRTLAWLAEAPGQRHLLTLGDPVYPAPLLQTVDPPALLYAVGDLDRLQYPALAIVGSRDATPHGLEHARRFADTASKAGICVVSGLALGIDGAAHEGALDGMGGTIAVVGTGLNLMYPRRHLALARKIAEQGLILSEFALGTPSLPANFPRRNRIIAGLAQGTLVVEATLHSGSLITAKLALDAGREVMALPGAIGSAQSRGCHQLIKDGAALIESPQELLELLGWAAPTPPPEGSRPRVRRGSAHPVRTTGAVAWNPQTPKPKAQAPAPRPDKEDPLLTAMGHEAATVDALVARTGWPADRLLARLLELELDGLVVRLPGGLLQRRATT